MQLWLLLCLSLRIDLVLAMAAYELFDVSGKTVGFLGTGKISSCMVRGYATSGVATSTPRRILVSPRNEGKANALKADFPDLVEIAVSNEQVVEESDIVYIGLLPAVARDILPRLPFGGSSSTKLVVSMMATVDLAELFALTSLPADQLVRTVPLPSSARREGPILVHPIYPRFMSILSTLGTPVGCANEQEMKPLVCLTGHISSFFELMNETQNFMIREGVDAQTARAYVSSFYSSLAHSTELSGETLSDMAEEAATPGGINEQAIGFLKSSDHFELQAHSLGAILARLKGTSQSKK